MTMPATPMNDAALRYSPEMAEAFQPTLTLRPATKKSCAVFERRADQNPIQIVAMTVSALKEKIQGSMFMGWKRGKGEKEKRGRGASSARTLGSRQEPRFGVALHLDKL